MNNQQRAAAIELLTAMKYKSLREISKAEAALREALAQPQDSQSNYDLAIAAGFSDWEVGTSGNRSATKQRRMARIHRLINLARSSGEQPQGEPVAWGEVVLREGEVTVSGYLYGQLPVGTKLYTTPPSVEAVRVETLEKVAQVCDITSTNLYDDNPAKKLVVGLAAAIRSMK